jgi:hypothetical protein
MQPDDERDDQRDHGMEGCGRRRLAESSAAIVDACSCGTLQVHLGPISVRIPAEELHALVATLSNALAQQTAHEQAHGPYAWATCEPADA